MGQRSQSVTQGWVGALVAFAIAACPMPISAQQLPARLPKFVDYPAEVFRAKKPPLMLDREDLQYKTRLRALYNSSPNFGGHYSISVVGCGTDCIFLLVVDVKTGRSTSFDVPSGEDLAHCDEDRFRDAKGGMIFHDFVFRPESRLFLVIGKMAGNECGVRYFVENDGKMTLLRDVHLKPVT
jgi:hypothetical protein